MIIAIDETRPVPREGRSAAANTDQSTPLPALPLAFAVSAAMWAVALFTGYAIFLS